MLPAALRVDEVGQRVVRRRPSTADRLRARRRYRWASCSQVNPMPPCNWMLFCALKIWARMACAAATAAGEPGALQVVGPGGVPGRGGGLLGVDEHVGGVVLDGLEGADGAAELLAHLGVLDRHVQAGPATRRPPRPRPGCGTPCARRRAAPRSTRSAAICRAAQVDTAPTDAGGVQGRQCGDGDAVGGRRRRTTRSSPAASTSTSASGAPSTARATARVAVRSDSDVHQHVEARAPRPCVPSARPGSSWARTESGAHRSITTAAATVGRNGPGVQLPPGDLGDDRQLGQPEARPAELLGDGQSIPAEFGSGGPDFAASSCRVARAWRGPRRGCPRRLQPPEGRGGEILVFFGDGQRRLAHD